MFPAGHVYGTIHVIKELASQYKAVILSVDSRSQHRYEVLPEYKSGRHAPTGNPYDDYKIMTDLMNILKLCTYKSNVFYIKHEGMESDDIIASWIDATNSDDSKDLYCYFNDVDILQTHGNYHWFRSFSEPEVDRSEYLNGKFGLDMDYLPVWWKVVRGDPSDGIPSSVPRFPSKKLRLLCSESAGKDIPWFMQKIGYPGIISGGDIWRNMERNLKVIEPKIIPIDEFKLKRLGISYDDGIELLKYYQINDFVLDM